MVGGCGEAYGIGAVPTVNLGSETGFAGWYFQSTYVRVGSLTVKETPIGVGL